MINFKNLNRYLVVWIGNDVFIDFSSSFVLFSFLFRRNTHTYERGRPCLHTFILKYTNTSVMISIKVKLTMYHRKNTQQLPCLTFWCVYVERLRSRCMYSCSGDFFFRAFSAVTELWLWHRNRSIGVWVSLYTIDSNLILYVHIKW